MRPLGGSQQHSRPELVRHFLYFPSRATAQQASDVLIDRGLRTTVQRSGDTTSWLTLVFQPDGASPSEVDVESARLRELAAQLKGEYDGWETTVAE
ncbi:MAG: ribonuclease E inhibitor RraB [Chloroflexi bacterium]|nr:ribonuclease E inhibitor RraB [Chloroflexota bacterium]MBV9895817.1 ribonuclease E inhibitor RraB [Chloroflexota bacterium]